MNSKIRLGKHGIFFIMVAGLLLRLFLGFCCEGHISDLICFKSWADRMVEVGPAGFYSKDYFSDYPPAYMYVLYFIDILRKYFHIVYDSNMHILLLKLPAILIDMITACLMYRISCNKLDSTKATLLAASYLFNPAILHNSSVWGQVDSLITLAVILMCISLINGKLLPAYISFGMGVLLKPQMLVFTPVLLSGILEQVFLQDFTAKKLFRNLFQGLGVILGMVLFCLPFGLDKVFEQYLSTLSSYGYASVNAYNFWALLGLNWASQDGMLFFLSYKQWSSLVILLIVGFVLIISLRMRGDSSKYPLLAAFTILSLFLFSVRMHERYCYPLIALLLLFYLYKPQKSVLLCYGGFSLMHFCNTAHVLLNTTHASAINNNALPLQLISAGTMIGGFYFYRMIVPFLKRKS